VHALAGPYAAAAALVALAGLVKLARPGDTARALGSVRLPASRALVRGLGAAEVGVAGVAVSAAGPIPAALLAATYTGFAGFVLLALRRGGTLRSCGCFGRPDTPPTGAHLVVNVAAAGVAGAVALHPGGRPLAGLAAEPWAGVPLVLLSALCGWLGYLALAVLPRTLRAGRP
jgi:hypothetical protein